MEPNSTSPAMPQTPMPLAPQTPSSDSHMLWYVGAGVVLCALLAGFYFLWPHVFTPVKQEKVYHVGVLNALDYFGPTVDGFKERMTELGYVEGKNITYDVQKAPEPVGNQAIIKKFVDDKVDLILAFPTEASIEAKEGTKGTNIPIVSTEAAYEGNDLAESIQRPGGNLTGVRFPIPEIAAKRLEILHQLAPKATRVWVPFLKDYPTVPPSLEVLRSVAREAGITLIETPFVSPDELGAYLAAQSKKPEMDAVLFIPEPISIVPPFADQIHAFVDKHKLPMAGVILREDDKGPMFSLIPSAFEIGQLAAPLADKIFKGTPPGEIPIVTPESVFEINIKVVQRLGLTVSEGLLSTADRVVH